MQTGWTGEGPDGGPAVPVTGFAGFIGSMRGGPEDRPDPLTRAMRAPEPRDPEPRDPDEIAANLMGRGYPAGHVSDLGQRLADKSAELAGERAKIERGERVTARVRGMLERGQIGGLAAARMMDGDFGDAHRAEQLERQCANLKRQIGDASAMIAPQQERTPDQFASANRTAHELFREVTRQRMAEAQAGRPAAPRPFFAGRGGIAVRSEVTCAECIKVGATPEQSFLIHADPVPEPAPAEPDADEAAWLASRQPGAGRYQPVQTPRGEYVYDKDHQEITRVGEVVERWPVRYDDHGMAVR